MNRRDFLKAGACGALWLAGGAGCGRRQRNGAPPALPAGAVRSSWHEPAARGRLRCTLCPHRCELADGERARCRVRMRHGDALYSLAYGNPALLLEDVIERTPFFHVLPGSRALSVSTAGCNLACQFCEVWDMALANPEDVHAYEMPPERVIAHAQASPGVRSVGYGFGEPTVFIEYMTAMAERARAAGLLNLLHTAGYIEPAPLRSIAGLMDAANVDLKGFDPAFYRDVTGGELAPVLATLKRLAEASLHIEITNIVIPSLNDDMAAIGRMCRWIVAELGPHVPLHFARFYPLYRLSNLPQTPVATLDRARATAREAGLRFVYVSRVTGHEAESSYCPVCNATVVERTGFVVDAVRLNDGLCAACDEPIPGRWS